MESIKQNNIIRSSHSALGLPIRHYPLEDLDELYDLKSQDFHVDIVSGRTGQYQAKLAIEGWLQHPTLKLHKISIGIVQRHYGTYNIGWDSLKIWNPSTLYSFRGYEFVSGGHGQYSLDAVMDAFLFLVRDLTKIELDSLEPGDSPYPGIKLFKIKNH